MTKEYHELRKKAYSMLIIGKESGAILPATDFKCVYCGNDATEYDHRDYAMPYCIEATCHKCNLSLGSGMFAFSDKESTTKAFVMDVPVNLLRDFDIAAKLNHQNRSVFLRTLMVEAVKKETRRNHSAFKEHDNAS